MKYYRPVSFFFCVFITHHFFAQSAAASFRHLSRPEKCWAIAHPFIAGKAWHITQHVRVVTDSLEKNNILKDGNGGQLDAFRHAYWMASLVQEIPARKAEKLGKAHEKGNYLGFRKGKTEDAVRADSVSCVMDLQNNGSGISIGKKFKTDTTASKEQLVAVVLNDVRNGKLVVVKKDNSGNALTCDGKMIDAALYEHKWYIPKCLVRSDEVAEQ